MGYPKTDFWVRVRGSCILGKVLWKTVTPNAPWLLRGTKCILSSDIIKKVLPYVKCCLKDDEESGHTNGEYNTWMWAATHQEPLCRLSISKFIKCVRSWQIQHHISQPIPHDPCLPMLVYLRALFRLTSLIAQIRWWWLSWRKPPTSSLIQYWWQDYRHEERGDGEAEEHRSPMLGAALTSHTKPDTLKHLTLAKVMDEFI